MPGHILVVDDDPLVLTMLRKVLATEGFDVNEATDAERAMGILSRSQHDLVLCDVRLPGRDGFELLREVRLRHPGTDVMLMTGYGSVDGAVDAMANGATDYLTKPLRPKEIVARANAVFGRRRLERQLRELQSELQTRGEVQTAHHHGSNGSVAVAPIAMALGDRERQLVVQAVSKHPGHLDQAARELGISRTTLWRRMRKYNIPAR